MGQGQACSPLICMGQGQTVCKVNADSIISWKLVHDILAGAPEAVSAVLRSHQIRHSVSVLTHCVASQELTSHGRVNVCLGVLNGPAQRVYIPYLHIYS